MEKLDNFYKSLNNSAYEPAQHELWALALSAPCYANPLTSMELVTGLSSFSAEKRRINKNLIDEFGYAGPCMVPQGPNLLIHDISMDILRHPGQVYYQYLRMRLILLSDGANGWINQLPPEGRKQKQASLLLKNLYLLPIAGIQAWNISRAIYYDRCSLLLGLEGCNSAMSKIMRNAQLAQVLYSSWEEYFTAYAMGAQFMHPEVLMPEGLAEKLENIIDYIYAHQRNTLPWNLKLGYSYAK